MFGAALLSFKPVCIWEHEADIAGNVGSSWMSINRFSNEDSGDQDSGDKSPSPYTLESTCSGSCKVR